MQTNFIIQNLFNLTDQFKNGPYQIKDIKRIWNKVLIEAWYKEYDNKILLEKSIFNYLELSDLRVDDFKIEELGDMKTINLLNDLTYTGKTKRNQKYSTTRTFSIFQLMDALL